MNLDDFAAGFGLTDDQRLAVGEPESDVLVTAGAGSGKTRTLVARYLWLLANGVEMRAVLAITFTEKAAREMRNRVRVAITELAGNAESAPERALWAGHIGEVDSARIGTIHSFCAELLRAHPAEAGVDPEFEVVEEGQAALYKSQAVEDALSWASGQPEVASLFSLFTPRRLAGVLERLLEKRLDLGAAAQEANPGQGGRSLLRLALGTFLDRPDVDQAIQDMRSLSSTDRLRADAGPKLAAQTGALLAGWDELAALMEADRLIEAAARLFELRRNHMALNIGKRDSLAKAATQTVRWEYAETAEPWLGGKSSDLPPHVDAQAVFDRAMAGFAPLFDRALRGYRRLLAARSGLDFDDLERRALDLLSDQGVRTRWQGKISHVLVDEFQDTNSRQRDIVDALKGDERGRLFIVGDARQSIYRFRGAEVEVFRRAGRDMAHAQGRSVQLELTFRAHRGLLSALDDLLGPVMGTAEDREHIYRVPYRTLRPHRDDPRPGSQPPHVEFVLGRGDRAAAARADAAKGLTSRLLELKDGGAIHEWDDVALLFRASTAFDIYESALEAARIPFVTVAGRGFFHRPEIRDVLNILRALAEPWDELAVAGMLRSPAFGLSDAGLYRLRWPGGAPGGLRQDLGREIVGLTARDRSAVRRANRFLSQFESLADRLPVAELLKQVIDWLGYRAILAGAQSRLWRNLDKLLADAHASDAVQVQAFLDYVASLRDVGAREGEAPVEAEGAVRLMTIHKAKGLEFDVVVLADASRQPPTQGELVYALPEGGIVARPDRDDVRLLAYEISKWVDAAKSSAEEDRLLYVAATRAREKWIISGHLTGPDDRPRADGWTGALLAAVGLEPSEITGAPQNGLTIALPGGQPMRVRLAGGSATNGLELENRRRWPVTREAALFRPLAREGLEQLDDELGEIPERAWRATGGGRRAPAVAVGGMVHEAIRRWEFRPELAPESTLDSLALAEGLVDPEQRGQAVKAASRLLRRLREHPIWAQIASAESRHHEVPYTRPAPGGRSEAGRIDLLYRRAGKWCVIDFKTDELADADALAAAVNEYRPQMARYARSVQALLGGMPLARLCFLDYQGRVQLQEIGLKP